MHMQLANDAKQEFNKKINDAYDQREQAQIVQNKSNYTAVSNANDQKLKSAEVATSDSGTNSAAFAAYDKAATEAASAQQASINDANARYDEAIKTLNTPSEEMNDASEAAVSALAKLEEVKKANNKDAVEQAQNAYDQAKEKYDLLKENFNGRSCKED